MSQFNANQQASPQQPSMFGAISAVLGAVIVGVALLGVAEQTVPGNAAVTAPVVTAGAAVQVEYLPAQLSVHATEIDEPVATF